MNARTVIFATAILACGPAAATGESSVTACLECHGRAEYHGQAPAIAGQHDPYMQVQLRRFRDRHRDVFPMSAFAGGLDDDRIAAIAGALSRLPWIAQCSGFDATAAEQGAAQAGRMGCPDCHGAGFEGVEVIPRLAGQDPVYLERQIRNFIQGRRYHPPTASGLHMDTLEAPEVAALAAYINSLGPCPARAGR
ncbi:MAG TPA: c-type cytochrome [Xanthomonadaceae bacterium]|nr:c-type cytochrome [Xanthomonadaceae bacterium]